MSAEDTLKVQTAAILDLSEDGRLVAVGARRLFDNAETNHRRYGDPTYFAPSMVELRVDDTRTGATDKVGKGLMNVRQAAFTRNGSKLAVLTAAESSAGLPLTSLWVYDVRPRHWLKCHDSAAPRLEQHPSCRGHPTAGELFVALRSPADDVTAQTAFKTLTTGPVVVQSSKPFLDWDAMSRANRRRSLAEIDPATGAATMVVAPAAITNYQLARDGSFVTWLEDSTEKTSYDVIFGTDNAVRTQSKGASARTVLDAKTLKTTTPRWSDDQRSFAYAEKGEVFVQRIDDDKPRSITPKPKQEATGTVRTGGHRVVFRRFVFARRFEAAHHQQEGLVHRNGCRRITRSRPDPRRQERGQEPETDRARLDRFR